MRIANSPVSWGVDHLERPGLPRWEHVFDEIRDAGYTWVELGAYGFLPADPHRARQELDRRGLQVAGSYMLEPVHDLARRTEVLEGARCVAEYIAGAGGQHLVIVDWGSPERGATAGRSDAAPRLTAAQQSAYFEVLTAIADVARETGGLTALAHPHAGTWLEFEDEIVDLLQQTDLALCIDTGHFAYAGADPVALYDQWAHRVGYLNFKDVDGARLAEALRRKLSFLEAVDLGVFCSLGDGIVDFRGMREALERHGYDGHATVEQDRDPRGDTTALEDARRSLAFLRDVGLAI